MILPNTAAWKKIANDLGEFWNLLHVTVYIVSENIAKKCPEKSGSTSKTGKTLTVFFYHCDFVVRDIKVVVCVELPQKINFNLLSDFFS